jgi:hypothetical protein
MSIRRWLVESRIGSAQEWSRLKQWQGISHRVLLDRLKGKEDGDGLFDEFCVGGF